jgi:serine/threonine protein kinase
MNISDCVVKYINHWYDDTQGYSYILMEYCPGGSLADEILKRKRENRKFSEEVFI